MTITQQLLSGGITTEGIFMEKKVLCPGCMRIINKISICAYCGYDLKNIQIKSYQLKPYTILGEQQKRYIVGKVVGEGAFGITYVALDKKLEMKVAIKEFYPRKYAKRVGNAVELHPQEGFDIAALREEMISEARNLAKLDQLEGVVEVKDYFRDNDTIYIVMEYIEGGSLKDYLKQNGGKLQVEIAKRMMRPVIESLMQVHNAGMIHRDISPDNIMVTPEGKMKLIDFGTAKESNDTDILALGKKGYAPPEQFAKDGKQGTWTDVYALAATYYGCIVGRTPPVSTERLKNDTLVYPSQLGISINPIEEEALVMALSPDPNTRFKDMKALYNAFYNQSSPIPNSVSPNPQPPISPQPPVPPTPSPDPQNKMVFLITAIAAVTVIVLVSSRFISPKPLAPQPSISSTSEQESTITITSTVEDVSPNAELLDEWQKRIDAKEYRDVIEEITLRVDELEVAEKEEAGKLLEKALDKEQKAAIVEANTFVSSEDYAGALDLLKEAIAYTEELNTSDFTEKYIDLSALEKKYESVYSTYKTFLSEEGMQAAGNHDEGRINTMFQKADNYFEGEEYEQLKIKVYTELVYANIGQLSNETPEQAVSYISSHVEKTDYNCWVIEFLDFFRSQMELPAISNSVTHVSEEGYILPYSSSMYLSSSDLSMLSQFELYLAYFEIYARHERKFNDPAVNEYFSQYWWYKPTIEPNLFNESSLNEYEKANVETIYQFQKNMGYR